MQLLVEREKKRLIDSEENNKDLAIFIIVRAFLKTNKQGNNSLFYVIEKKDYYVLDKIAEYGFLNNIQQYLEQIKNFDLVEIAADAIIKDYSKLFDFLFKILQQDQNYHYILEILNKIKGTKKDFNENTKNKFVQLCHLGWFDILENTNIGKESKEKLLILVNNSEEYDNQFKTQFALDIGLKEYILDDICTTYLEHDSSTQLTPDHFSSLFSILDHTDNTKGFINETNLSTPQTETFAYMNNSKNPSPLYLTHIITFVLGLSVYHYIFSKKYNNTGSPDVGDSADSKNKAVTSITTGDDSVSNNPIGNADDSATVTWPKADLLSSEVDEFKFIKFFERIISNMKLLARTEKIEGKIPPLDLQDKMKEFRKNNLEYIKKLEVELTKILDSAYQDQHKFEYQQKIYKQSLHTLAKCVGVKISSASSSVASQTLESAAKGTDNSLITSTSNQQTVIEVIGETETQSISFADDLS